MMILVSGVTLVALYVAQRKLTTEVNRDMQHVFRAELLALDILRTTRHAAMSVRCQALVRRARIQAALEDDALDLLYPSARDELSDLRQDVSPDGSPALHAEFYRFLDLDGRVIPPPDASGEGRLTPDEEAQLVLPGAQRKQQFGCIVRNGDRGEVSVREIIATPIISLETDQVLAALVIGFDPVMVGEGIESSSRSMFSGVWFNGQLFAPSLAESIQAALASAMSSVLKANADDIEHSLTIAAGGEEHRLFYQRLNSGSSYAPVYEVCLFSLADLVERERRLRWQILGAGCAMLMVGFFASHYFSRRLSVPVEMLELDSERNRVGRERAETALEQSAVELQRSARFSADASHQLKTPVAVLRAGLEVLLARDDLPEGARDEIADFIHQTYRLGGVIDDLLLLSRMDAGRLQLDFEPVNLARIVEGELDDFDVQPDALGIAIESEIPGGVHVLGERRYTTMIVRNLLENARKYNRLGGVIRITLTRDGDHVRLSIGNNGNPIPVEAQGHIFERFHRGSANENVSGHGLGLNIGRDLALLHGGDLRLATSANDWTEFEVSFRGSPRSIDLKSPGFPCERKP
ncbi:MAG: HAMP domain-containing histidine kinase [Verrucomicrobiae bacterium]|nr:HAMP domain-containing histidine kinase [Verrucomicrobiae bacterium]